MGRTGRIEAAARWPSNPRRRKPLIVRCADQVAAAGIELRAVDNLRDLHDA